MVEIPRTQISVSREVIERYCDGCGKYLGVVGNSRGTHCGECHRTYCKECYGERNPINNDVVYMIPCKSCREVIVQHPEYVERLTEIAHMIDNLRNESDLLKDKIGKESTEKHPSAKPILTA